MTFGARAISFRPGLVRLEDVLPQVADADAFEAVALDATGTRVTLEVQLTEKWAATSWQKQLQCGRCSCAARVLQVVAGIAICRRCRPERTAHHKHKNSSSWRSEGEIADELIRSLMKCPPAKAHRRRQRLARRLKRNTLARAGSLLSDAQHLIKVVDNLPR